MGKINYLLVCLAALLCWSCTEKKEEAPSTLKDAYEGKFLIGAAVNTDISGGADTVSVAVLKREFNSIVAENCMKSMFLQPKEGEFFFDDADQFVQFGLDNNMHMVGHTLIWHSQAPEWFFVDEKGNDVSREVLIERMKNHITTVVSRYKGKIAGWDVVNEAILDDGAWRESKFYRIIGPEFVELAFRFAHEADPGCELYYNDYSMYHPGRRDAVVEMVKNLKDKGVRIDGIGIQGHYGMDYPSIEELEKGIVAFAETGCKIMITELDFTVLPELDPNVGADVAASFEYQQSLDPYKEGLPLDVSQSLDKRYIDMFRLFLKHQDKITRVTTWGISDDVSWRNNWPIPGRTDYPLLFDRNRQPKMVVQELIRMASEEEDRQ